jgi:hypothetical protein
MREIFPYISSSLLGPHGRPEWEYKEVSMPLVEAKL